MKGQLRRDGGPGQLDAADRAGVVLTRVFSDYALVPLRSPVPSCSRRA